VKGDAFGSRLGFPLSSVRCCIGEIYMGFSVERSGFDFISQQPHRPPICYCRSPCGFGLFLPDEPVGLLTLGGEAGCLLKLPSLYIHGKLKLLWLLILPASAWTQELDYAYYLIMERLLC
jgi:hypothetical protein